MKSYEGRRQYLSHLHVQKLEDHTQIITLSSSILSNPTLHSNLLASLDPTTPPKPNLDHNAYPCPQSRSPARPP
ncbi:hypothetical protein VN97_g5405 [Penicillium thymicola]|uniref:Uncharacterized protein n=1 Tax=Penicillium thymicola TaxID=293382 RepID=A0AAI9X8Z6_PENTH|nr:hypothetical protein VN97_g5405 [Penicillium thymicola]